MIELYLFLGVAVTQFYHGALDGCPADRPPAQARALAASAGRGDDIRRLVRLPGSVRPLATQL